MDLHLPIPIRRLRLAPLALGLLLTAAAPPAALAQSAKIFVASYGSDSNVGNSVSPMRNFQAAHDAVAAGGEIVVLDTGGYGALTIRKSVSVVVPPGVNGFVTVSGNASGIFVNAAATDVVSLRGLIIEGGGSGGDSSGIVAIKVGTLRVEDCTVRNFETGINQDCSCPSHLLVSGGSVTDTQEGVIISQEYDGNNADAIFTDCAIVDNRYATQCYPDANAVCTLILRHCAITGSSAGVSNTAFTCVDACTITGNTTDLTDYSSAGHLVSRGNNTLANNAIHHAFASTLAAQ